MISKLRILLEIHSLKYIHILCRLIRRNRDKIQIIKKFSINNVISHKKIQLV